MYNQVYKLIQYNVPINCKPPLAPYRRVRIIEIIDFIFFMKLCPYIGKFNLHIFLRSWLFHLEIKQLWIHAIHQFNTKTHNMIYSMYCTCVHLNCNTIWWIKIPTHTVSGGMDFSGDLIWKAAPEVRNLTEVQGKIPYCPHLFLYGGSGA